MSTKQKHQKQTKYTVVPESYDASSLRDCARRPMEVRTKTESRNQIPAPPLLSSAPEITDLCLLPEGRPAVSELTEQVVPGAARYGSATRRRLGDSHPPSPGRDVVSPFPDT